MKYTIMTLLALFVSGISIADETTEEIQIPDTVDMQKFEQSYSNLTDTDTNELQEKAYAAPAVISEEMLNNVLASENISEMDTSRLNQEQKTALANTDQSYDVGCAIWLCLPAGFPGDQCRAPHKEMLHRLKHGHFPLPTFGSCVKNFTIKGLSVKGLNNSEFSYNYNDAALIPAHQECTSYKEETVYTQYGPQKKQTCLEYGLSDASFVKDRACNPNCGSNGCHPIPEGCTDTYKYIDVLIDGQTYGQTYYFKL